MKLRGHHLFCTALFSGHGYDQRFTDEMNALLLELRLGRAAQVFVGADRLCAVCPNHKPDDGCALGTGDVKRRDAAALHVLGLQQGEYVTWAKAQHMLSKITEPEFQAVCGGCRWQKSGLCSFKLLQERVKAPACN